VIATPPPPAPPPEPIRFEALLAQSWTLFRRNWIVALPPVIGFGLILIAIVAFTAAIVVTALHHGSFTRTGNGFVTWILFSYLGLIVVIIAVNLWVNAAVYGMADAVWARGTTTFADGNAAFRARGGALFVAGLGIAGVAIAAFLFLLPTLGLSFLAFAVFTMYVLPSAIGGGRGGFEAIAESFRLVRSFFGASAISWLVLAGIRYGIGMLSSFAILPVEFSFIPMISQTTPHLPPIGFLASAGLVFVLAILAAFAYAGYYAIAVVGLYRSLRAQPGAGGEQVPGWSLTV
jgi:hypothetical protein